MIEAAFGDVAAGHQAVDPPTAADLGMRWSDVPLAVAYACDDVEMAVARKSIQPEQCEFDLRTVEGGTGRLRVRRTYDDRVYEAVATIGSIRDREERARELIDALAKQMRLFGKKRSLAED